MKLTLVGAILSPRVGAKNFAGGCDGLTRVGAKNFRWPVRWTDAVRAIVVPPVGA